MKTLGIVINKKAKNAAQVDAYLEAFTKAGLVYKVYKTSPSRLDAVIKTCMKVHQILVVGGGDGTVRSAAQQCVRGKIPLAILPLGTLNHFVGELALPATPDELARALKKQQTVTIDVAAVNHLIFVNNSSIGFYPKFAQKRDLFAKTYNKWLSYIPGFIQALRRYPSFHLTIKNEKIDLDLTTCFLMVSNNLYAYEFPFSFERTSVRREKLGLYYVNDGNLSFIKMIKYLFSKKENIVVQVSKDPVTIHIKGCKEIMISLDGETRKMKTPLIYESLPKALTLIKLAS